MILNITSHTILPMMPQMSPGEMQQLEQIEKQLMQEIDQYVNNLSPEEQRKFHEAVEEETRKIEQMKPEELNKYIENTFSGIEETLKEPGAPIAKPTEPTKPETTKEKEIKPEETEKQVKAINIIDSLIKRIESYLLKLNAMPEITAKLPKWAQQGRIVGWKPDMTSNSFKKELEALNQQLYKLKKRNEKNKKYIFLPDVVENEALLNNLAKVNNTLKNWEPQIKLRTLEFESITLESKKATIQATNILLEGLTVLALPKAIDDIIVKYDPIAKQKREEEEKKRQQALESSKRGSRPGPTRSVGMDSSSAASGAYQQGYYDTGAYHPSRRSRSGGYDSYGRAPSYTPTKSSARRAQPTRQPSAARATGRTSGSRDSKKGQATPDALGAPQAMDKTEDKKTTVAQPELTDQAKRRINAVGDSFERGFDRLEKSKITKPFTMLNDPKELVAREVQTELNYADRALQDFEDALSTIRRLSITGSMDQKKLYAKKLNNMMEEYKRPLLTFTDQIKKIKENQDSFSAEKRYAYLGAPARELDDDAFKAIVDKPFNIYKLGQLLQELQSAIRSLGAGQTVRQSKV